MSVRKKMDAAKELSFIIEKAIEDNSIDKLNQYLTTVPDLSEALNASTISILIKILKKGGKHEEKTLHVSCVLSCLQHFLNMDIESQKWEKLAEDISKLCELVFVISSSYIKTESIVQQILNINSTLVENVNSLADNMLKFMIASLLTTSISGSYSNETTLLMLTFTGSLLQKSSRGIRTEILPSNIDYLNELSDFLFIVGNYELQVSVVEILARCSNFVKDKQKQILFSNNPKVQDMFKKYTFLNFDPECRLFLNELNQFLGDKQMVYSLPCMVVSIDDKRLKKPNDPTYTEFWVDINLGPRSISFYYLQSVDDCWELMTIPEERVLRAIAKDSICQSRSGVKFEAVKIEITLKPDAVNSNLPETVKIYPRKDDFIKLDETIIKKVFNGKYKTEVTCTKKPGTDSIDKVKEAERDKSFVEMGSTVFSKLPEAEEENCDLVQPSPCPSNVIADLEKSAMPSILSPDESDEENLRDSVLFSNFIAKKVVENDRKNISLNSSQEDERLKTESNIHGKLKIINDSSFTKGGKLSPAKKITEVKSQNTKIYENAKNKNNLINTQFSAKDGSPEKTIHSSSKRALETEQQTSSCNENFKKSDNSEKRPSSSKKRRLYSSETSDTKDVILSSQDDFSIGMPTYKLPVIVEPKLNVKRENVSFSYITHREREKTNTTSENEQKEQTCVLKIPSETQKRSSDNENSSEDDNKSSPSLLFRSPSTKPPKPFEGVPSKTKFFTNNDKKVVVNKLPEDNKQSNVSNPKSSYSDFGSPKRGDRTKKTYARPKPKRPWRRIRVMTIKSSDSDDSDYVPPTKLSSKNGSPTKKLQHRISTNLDHVTGDKIDPIRGNVFIRDMEVKAAGDMEEPVLEKREIGTDLKVLQERSIEKISSKICRPKNTKTDKKKVVKQSTRQTKNKNKKLEPKKKQEKICNGLEKSPEEVTKCMEVINYEPQIDSPLGCDDLALELLSCPDPQETTLIQTTFKVNDMLRFGKILLQQVQEKAQKVESLAQKEREMNLAAFDFKTQAACNMLFGSCQKLETVGSNLAKMKCLLETTHNLQRDIALQLQSEAAKIEEAKQDLIKNITKVDKTESSSVAVIFQGLGGYLKKLVLSLFQRSNKNALTK